MGANAVNAVPPTNVPPRIFLLGPQGSGKTTLRPYVQAWWRRWSGVRLACLGIEEAQRLLCPADRESPDYHYDENGALILVAQERLIQEALEMLASQCRGAKGTGFVAEVAHRRLGAVVATLGPDLFAGSLSLFLTAPIEVRLERNRRRGAGRIPEHVVSAYPGRLSPEEVTELLETGSSLCVLDTHSSLETTLTSLEQALTRHAEDLASTLEPAGGPA